MTSIEPRRRLVIAALVAVAFGLGTAVALRSLLAPHLFAGTVLQSDQLAPTLSELSFASGRPVELGTWDDELTLVYFGYLNCPDVCPTTLATIAQARARLSPEEQDRLHLVMVSVDPSRDPVNRVQDYAASFDPTFLGAGGSVEAIDRAATAYGVYYHLNRDEADDAGWYTVDHTASVMGIGPDGALRVVWGPTVTADQFVADFRALLAG